MKLGQRLLSAAALCRGERIIDIGSDHAFLPVWLLLNGKCIRAAASDINAKPLERGRATARKYGVEDRMDFYLSDGLDSAEGEYDTAFVCGMGGIMICDIIARGGDRVKRWVLQPMTNAELLRAFLWDNGYAIAEESYAAENRKPYAVIAAEKTGVTTAYGYNDTFLGKARHNSAEYRFYVQKVLSSAEKRLRGKKCEHADTADEEALTAECVSILRQVTTE